MRTNLMGMLGMVLVVGCTDPEHDADVVEPDAAVVGTGDTVFTTGQDPTNPFFQVLGTNDRTCASCHDVASGWSVTPAALQARFDASSGLDPVFRTVDGATSPAADDTSLAARRTAYALLLSRGVFRIGLPVPDGADFAVSAIDDPYGYASVDELSLYRRPLPSTNLRFARTLMWDGREPTLASQATDATLGHAQAMRAPAEAIVGPIVAFESSLYTAQAVDAEAGDLADGATGGPAALATQPATVPRGFTLYGTWATSDNARRRAIAHGEQLFNGRRFQIRGAIGLPDQEGTCATCHDAPNVGAHTTPLFVNLGIADAARRQPTVPLYTVTQLADGRTTRTTDPGLALTTGKFADVGRFKVPTLRGLAMRPPYFHDGSAAALDDVVRLYDRRFGIRLSPPDQRDLVAFLQAL
ncbi:MAG: hypothetical protein NT062_12950 [Proteobacteria bacterium]|nr:hypothetical protein [Pseudomonadota bacterium]